jgi:hypothetical protein
MQPYHQCQSDCGTEIKFKQVQAQVVELEVSHLLKYPPFQDQAEVFKLKTEHLIGSSTPQPASLRSGRDLLDSELM